jgi:hypothetical protein
MESVYTPDEIASMESLYSPEEIAARVILTKAWVKALEENREKKSKRGQIHGQKMYEQSLGIHAQTPEERAKLGRIGGLTRAWRLGLNLWSKKDGSPNLELRILDELRTESIGKIRKNIPSWDYVLERFTEEFPDMNVTKKGLVGAYDNNKHRLTDEEE